MAATTSDSSYRLPNTVHPTHYEVAIKTDLTSNPPTYAGEVVISLEVDEDTNDLVFNLHPSLNVTHISLAASGAQATAIPTSALKVDEETERATVDVSAAGGLKAGKDAKVFIRWEAELGGNMMGYYKSNGDKDKDGNRPIYALTQFEPTAARRALPCWDEPLHKATFALSMIARKHETVLANMNAESTEPWQPAAGAPDSVLKDGYKIGSSLDKGDSDWMVTKFATTPKISTYLVAFACGVFAHIDSEHKSKITGKTIPLRVYATPDVIKQAQLGLDTMHWALPIYEELFDVAYPLPKLDTLVAHDFDMGAMENWGLITGRTTAYLFDPEKSSLAAKKRVGSVQCHELAHMWFGDIVTMKWWDNLWLNEAFATLMGSLVLPERIWPEWKMSAEFLSAHWVRALDLDSRRSSHPIEVDCPDSSQINQIFDAISYSKGASVLRMLKGVVGDDKFFKGVSIYLKKHLYGNAETSDLWAGISESVGKDMGKVMANWTLKVGFPVVKVDENGGELKLTQNRFLLTGDVKADEDETVWWIPLEVKTVDSGKASVDHDAVLSERSSSYKPKSDVFKLNAETIGVYRVAYTPERLAKLGKQAQNFTVEDRVGLLSDASALAAAGYSSTSGALDLALGVAKDETEFLPLEQISGLLGRIVGKWWEDEEMRTAVNKVRVAVFRPIVDKMGYDHGANDTPDEKQLRALAVTVTASAGDEGVIKELQARCAALMDGDDSKIPADLQRTIFTKAVKHGGEAEWNKMKDIYENPPNPSTKVDAMAGLCASKDDRLIDRAFDMLADPKAIKDQDISIFFAALGENRYARRRVVEWFMDKWDMLNERFNASFGLRNGIVGTFGRMSSAKDLETVRKFFDSKDVKKYRLTVAQTIEGIQASADWVERDTKDVKEWLAKNKYL